LGESEEARILTEKNATIYVAGHTGMVGSAIVRRLQEQGFSQLILRSRKELDLCDQTTVRQFFMDEKPEYVFNAAARVGGIHANNTFRAQFIYENLQIQNNLIHFAHESGVRKLLFLGSSCIYPRDCPQPMKEKYLLSGPLEKTNEPYALAKIAGIKMCENYFRQYGCHYFSAMPTNAYGPNDNYDLETSHVLPALMRKIHEAKSGGEKKVTVWGSGKPTREFIHVDDIANACLFIMDLDFPKLYQQGLTHLNVGTGKEISIRALVEMIASVTGFLGSPIFDESMPDGTPKKVMDVSIINEEGWQHKIDLEDGLAMTYASFAENHTNKNVTEDATFERQTI
jgi:GDP-L-fucose synthase